MKLFVMDFFSLNNCTLCRPCYLHISNPCTCMAYMKSGKEYPNRIASFGLIKAHINFRAPNLPCTDITLFFGHLYGFLRFVVWLNSTRGIQKTNAMRRFHEIL